MIVKLDKYLPSDTENTSMIPICFYDLIIDTCLRRGAPNDETINFVGQKYFSIKS